MGIRLRSSTRAIRTSPDAEVIVPAGALSRDAGGSPAGAAGDFDANGQVNSRDMDLLCAAIMTNDSRFDLTGDGAVDRSDLNQFVTALLHTTFGDANLDGLFNSARLSADFPSRSIRRRSTAEPQSWAQGDWNCDGEFDSADLVLAFQVGAYAADAEGNK